MSKLDANSGFWKIMLAKESHELATFIKPFGHYSFNKLPISISSASENLQKKMSNILDGLAGVLCLMDDLGRNKMIRLVAALKGIQAAV